MARSKSSSTHLRSSSLHLNLLLMVSLTILFAVVVNSAYLGPRYGKRDFEGETLGRFVPRAESYGSRHIQIRSGARFYPGTRFGGKRAYWAPKPIQSDFEEPRSHSYSAGPSDVPETPYDCLYIPEIGVRCISPEDSNSWGKQNGGGNGRSDNDIPRTREMHGSSSKDSDRDGSDIDPSPLSLGVVASV